MTSTCLQPPKTNPPGEALSPEMVGFLRAKSLGSLYFFLKVVLGNKDMTRSVHRPLCKLLEDGTKKNKLVVLPRGWFKTTLASIGYPIWRALRNPSIRILICQNTFTNAQAKLATIRQQFDTNGLLRALFPEVLPEPGSRWRSDSLCLKRPQTYPEGTFECAGTGTQLTSRHYDLIIEDDTVAPEKSEVGEDNILPQKDDIVRAIGLHKLCLPLLDNPSTSEMLVIGTRWFEKDLISYIKENEKWFFLYERAILEKDGHPDEDGDPTFPERFPRSIIEQIETRMGRYLFSCLYMNKPLRSKDMIFDKERFSKYDTEPAHLLTYTTVDPAGDPEDSKGEPDYNAVVTCGKDLRSGRVYVLDTWRAKCSVGTLLNEIFRQVRTWGTLTVGVETIAYQKTLLYLLRQAQLDQNFFFHVEPIQNSRRSKNARIIGLQPLIDNGTLAFRPTQRELMGELEVFPLGRNDDLADALAMQLDLWAVSGRLEEGLRPSSRGFFTLDGLLEEFDQRAEEKKAGIIFDVYERPGPLVFN